MSLFRFTIVTSFLFTVFLFAGSFNHLPVVTVLRPYQSTEFHPTRNFTFQYNVYDEDGDYVTVLFQLSIDSGKTWYTPKNVSGDVGHRIRSNIVPPLYQNPAEDSLKKDIYSITWEIPKEPWWLINFQDLQWQIVADDHFEKPEIFEWVSVPVELRIITGAFHDEKKFHIMKYEVTNAEYIHFLNTAFKSNMLSVTNDWVGYYVRDEIVPIGNAFCFINQVVGIGNWSSIQWDGNSFFISDEYEDFPVIFVTIEGAQAFADFYGLQLPTSTQWYRAALGPPQLPFPWGGHVEYQQANFWDSQDPFDNGPTPFGFYDGRSYKGFKTWDSPSWYGCYDMVGNVSEWLRDSTAVGSSWYTKNLLDINSQSPTSLFNRYRADFQTGFRCVFEFFGRINLKANGENLDTQ